MPDDALEGTYAVPERGSTSGSVQAGNRARSGTLSPAWR
jgi:hypothetical protein